MAELKITLEDSGDLALPLGQHEVSTDESMMDEFIQENTAFNDWGQLLDTTGVKTSEDIESEEFSSFIAANTRFSDFDDLVGEASEEYIANQI